MHNNLFGKIKGAFRSNNNSGQNSKKIDIISSSEQDYEKINISEVSGKYIYSIFSQVLSFHVFMSL